MKAKGISQEEHISMCQDHRDGVLRKANSVICEKYEKGVREHGGGLFNESLAALHAMAQEEATDQMVYLITLGEKIEKVRIAVANLREKFASGGEAWEKLTEILEELR